MIIGMFIIGFIVGLFFTAFVPFKRLFKTDLNFTLFLLALIVIAVIALIRG